MKKIYAFQNFEGGGEGPGVAISEDGAVLASHWSSNDYWAAHDLGVTSNWKHEIYQKYYPEGFEVVFVEDADMDSHEGVQAAIKLAETNPYNQVDETSKEF